MAANPNLFLKCGKVNEAALRHTKAESALNRPERQK